ncbi:hypothetical protein [Flavobacterium aestivum]|uniref:hypothetical protein n=1 Tax=Flavobacterium aestivum TaxID=3003257 RepID=UPI002285AE75|nr:hypothetical protein [Flavobacterium aestivum]
MAKQTFKTELNFKEVPSGSPAHNALCINEDGDVKQIPFPSPGGTQDFQGVLNIGTHAEVGDSYADIMSVGKGITFTNFTVRNGDFERVLAIENQGVRISSDDNSESELHSTIRVNDGNIYLEVSDYTTSSQNRLTLNPSTVGFSDIRVPFKVGTHTLATTSDLPPPSGLDNVLGVNDESSHGITLKKVGTSEQLRLTWSEGISWLNSGNHFFTLNSLGFQTSDGTGSVNISNSGELKYTNGTKINKINLAKASNGTATFNFPDVTGVKVIALTSDLDFSSNVFVPTFSNPYQLEDSSSTQQGSYTQVKDVVTVTVPLALNITTAGFGYIDFTLPILSNSSFSDTFVGTITLFGDNMLVGSVKIVNNEKATFYFQGTTTGSYTGAAIFSYKKQQVV